MCASGAIQVPRDQPELLQRRLQVLHDRGGERSLFSQLPRALEEATGDGQTRIVVTSSGSEFAVTLSSQHFEEVAATDYAAIIDALLAARGEAKDLLCVVPQATLHWPGFMARLSKAIDARVVGIPDGLLAKVACSLVGHFPAAHATWRVPKLSNSEWQVALVKDGAP